MIVIHLCYISRVATVPILISSRFILIFSLSSLSFYLRLTQKVWVFLLVRVGFVGFVRKGELDVISYNCSGFFLFCMQSWDFDCAALAFFECI